MEKKRYDYSFIVYFIYLLHYVILTNNCFYFQLSNLTLNHFDLSVKQKGEYKGRKVITLNNHNMENTFKVTLSNTTHRDDEGAHDMIQMPNNPFCYINLYEAVLTHYPPPPVMSKSIFFRRCANEITLKVCK